jgi:dolichol kinase
MNIKEAKNALERKIFHGSITGVVAPLLAVLIKNDQHLKIVGVIIYAVFLALFALLEFALRRGLDWNIPFASNAFNKIANSYERENRTMIGGLYIILSGMFLITILYRWAAILGIMIQAYGDSAAAIFGRGFPNNPLFYNRKKHIEGTLAFIVFSLIVSLFCLSFIDINWNQRIFFSSMISIVSGLIESLPVGLYCFDNLSVPLISGLMAQIFIFL